MFYLCLGSWEWVDGLDDNFHIRQVLVGGQFWCWAHWAQFSMDKVVYSSIYSIFITILVLYSSQGRWEWVDGHGYCYLSCILIASKAPHLSEGITHIDYIKCIY